MPSETTATAWNEQLLRNPHAVADKRRRVQRMFAAIAPSYDLNNRLHSLWMDQWWRRKAVQLATLNPTDRVIDVACGTGDLTLAFAHALVWRENAANFPGRILGVDFTFEMLPFAREKWLHGGVLFNRPTDSGVDASIGPAVSFLNGDAQSLPL